MANVIFDGTINVNSIINWLLNHYDDHVYIFSNQIEKYQMKILLNKRVHFNYYDYFSSYNSDILIKNIKFTITLIPIINNPQHMRFINKHLYHQKCDAYLITTSLCNHSHKEQSKKLNNANIRHLKMSKQALLSNLKYVDTTVINTRLIEIIKNKASTNL